MIKLFIFALLLMPKPYDVEVRAEKLYWDYKKDKAKADKLYLDKKIFVHGIVKERSLNLWHVFLVTPEPELMAATIDDDQLVISPAFNPGDRFDMVCVGAGLVFNVPRLLRCRNLTTNN